MEDIELLSADRPLTQKFKVPFRKGPKDAKVGSIRVLAKVNDSNERLYATEVKLTSTFLVPTILGGLPPYKTSPQLPHMTSMPPKVQREEGAILFHL